jgi:hypothetical protein
MEEVQHCLTQICGLVTAEALTHGGTNVVHSGCV